MATMNDMDGIKTAFKDNVVVVTAVVDLILKLIMCNAHCALSMVCRLIFQNDLQQNFEDIAISSL